MAIFKSRQKSASANLQSKTATADTDDIVILPDTGYDGMSTVTVHPTPSETKTVTATTSSQTVTPTSGKFISEVTVEPQAHTTTYTPATNTAANDMGANHEYRYVNTSGMVTPSGTKRITQNGTEDVTNYASVHVQVSESPLMIHPNNESPATIARSNIYQADANGYAIASYDSVTPQSVPTSVSSGDIVKFEDSGIILDEMPTPQPFKIVTATTSQQTVTPDSGYYGLLEVIVEPQNHTTTFTPQANSVDDMGDVHNYRYVDTSGMVRPSSITPSNSNPDTLTSGSAVTPTANGYAIANYDTVDPLSTPTSVVADDIVKFVGSGKIVDDITSITPSSTPTSVASGDNIHIGGSGVIVDSIPTPTSLTPSNSSPATITSGQTYTATASGVAVETVDYINPLNINPAPIAENNPFIAMGAGYAIQSYSSKTPSDSSPASVSANSIIKPSSAGYLYKSSGLGKCKAGTFTSSTSAQTINLGFQPKYIMVMSETRTTNIFDYSYSSTKGIYAATSTYPTEYTISGNTSNNRISAITSTGFTFNKSGSSGATMYYFAVG